MIKGELAGFAAELDGRFRRPLMKFFRRRVSNFCESVSSADLRSMVGHVAI